MTKPKITICVGSSCFARGNEKNVDLTEKFLKERGLKDEVDVDLSGCLCTGNCARGPIVIVNDKLYDHVEPGMMLDILKSTFAVNP